MRQEDHQKTDGFTLIELLIVIATVALFLAMPAWLAFSAAKAKARSATCLYNHQRLGLSWVMYAHDQQERLPGAFDWVRGDLSYTPNNPDNTNRNLLLEGKLGPYLADATAYKCPGDQSKAQEGPLFLPRVRTVSMNQMIRPESQSRGWTFSPPWTIYARLTDIRYPSPANLWVFLEENPDSVNDAAFAVVMDRQKWGACWQDGPSILHNGGCALSFGDGHAEIRKWKDPQTLEMKVTYQQEFPYGLVQPYNMDIQWIQDRTTAWH